MKVSALIVVFFTALFAQAQSKEKIRKGDDAIDFAAITEDGAAVRLSDLNDKYILLDFTHIGCGPCWQSYPHLTEVQAKYKENLRVVTFHIDDMKDKWKEFAERRGIAVNWLTLWDIENKNDVMKQYQIDGFPYYFLIDETGKIVEKIFGYNKNKINSRLKKHLE